jgi:hypothetical protein
MRSRLGKLLRRDKKLVMSDIRNVRKEANELARETRKDLFQSGKMTIRAMERKEKHIDRELNRLEDLLKKVSSGHEEYHRLKHTKHSLQALKERIRLEKKRKKYENKQAKYKRPTKKSKIKKPLVAIVHR